MTGVLLTIAGAALGITAYIAGLSYLSRKMLHGLGDDYPEPPGWVNDGPRQRCKPRHDWRERCTR